MSRPFSAFRANARDHRAGILVAALSSAFGVALVGGVDVLSAYIGASDVGQRQSAKIALTVVGVIFFIVAVYVGAIVITNTFATVIAGRIRTIALLRLIGSSARAQRRAVAGEGLAVGLFGALIGGAAAAVLALVAVRVFVATGALPDGTYPVLSLEMVPPVVVVVLTTWLASWVGSRRVLTVTPVQALGAAQERPLAAVRSRGRAVVSLVLLVLGGALLALGLLLGVGAFEGLGVTRDIWTYGVLVALAGGIVSFTGVIQAAPFFLPAVLRAVGLVMGRSAATRLAAANAVRNPERSSRTAIGLVIGVTLITMFVVAASTWQQQLRAAADGDPALYQDAEDVIGGVLAVFTVLVGFSAAIAACGVVNSLSVSVLQRRRELGLLRALGFSAVQIRRMVLAESAQLVVASVVTGLALGTAYGWIGAQSLLGMLPGGGLLAPALPWPFLAAIAVAAAVLAVVAALAPTRRATRVSPVEALAVE
ncbi:ABC transporter permease [Leifsonia virtsii]|uniref:ABC transporter permease n=1 Tax=Leifsonia virtsii TaxID=3035915 RepID=A0ABT8ITU5_9MICO|nr:ABC transporter permease [Leifsonia virtsii]MDN4596239.1 ABC transporter permease [Leifsonia virtsii]